MALIGGMLVGGRISMNVDLPGTSVRMAMAVIGILPIVIIYPFVQKHFIKGVVLGAVKG